MRVPAFDTSIDTRFLDLRVIAAAGDGDAAASGNHVKLRSAQAQGLQVDVCTLRLQQPKRQNQISNPKFPCEEASCTEVDESPELGTLLGLLVEMPCAGRRLPSAPVTTKISSILSSQLAASSHQKSSICALTTSVLCLKLRGAC